MTTISLTLDTPDLARHYEKVSLDRQFVHGPNTIQSVRKEVLSRAPYREHPEARGAFGHHVTVEELGRTLRDVGFRPQSIDLKPNIAFHPTPEPAVEFSQASSFGNDLGHLPLELQGPARRDLIRELERLRAPEGIRQEGVRIVAIAVKDPV